MLRRHISAVMVTVFIVFILINFIFSYSLFKFYKSVREEIDQEISGEEREEDVIQEKIVSEQRRTTRLHFHREEAVLSLNTVDGSETQTDISETIENVTETAIKPVESKKHKKPLSTNFTTTIEPKPEYYNSDEYYGDSNENLADKNYNNYDEGKFLVITSPGIQPENNKIKLD